MAKIPAPIGNDFCPQTLFLYGTYKKDGTPNFGLFCWISYCCWGSEIGVMACIGLDKLTKDRIRETGMFSANLVTENLLPLADYCGCNDGYTTDKTRVLPTCAPGNVLHVPTLTQSPVSMELEVIRTVSLGDGEVYLCKIRHVSAEESLLKQSESLETRMRRIAPIHTTCRTYFSYDGKVLGAWGDLQSRL